MRPKIVSITGMAVLALSGCSSNPVVVASAFVTSQLIHASEGGTVTVSASDSPSLAGTSIVIPANALSADTRITIGYGGGTASEWVVTPSPTASLVTGSGKGAGPVVYVGPDGTAFQHPVTVTIPFVLPAGTQVAQLLIYALEGSGQSYQIDQSALQISGSFVSFTVSGLTQFQPGVSESLPPPDDGGMGDGGDGGPSDGGVLDGGPGDSGIDAGIDAGGCQFNETTQPDGGCCWGQSGQGPCGLAVRGSADCCGGLACGSSNFCVPLPGLDAGPDDAGSCGRADAGSPCNTTVDCDQSLGLVCSSTASLTPDGPVGDGVCEAAVAPPPTCSAATTACGGATDKPCCGLCVNGFCQNLGAQSCSTVNGATCTGDPDCCTGLKCVMGAGSGTCQPTCGQIYSSCVPANGNGDCCTNQGFTCTSAGAAVFGANLCETPSQTGVVLTDCSPNNCNAVGDAGPVECVLGSACIPTSTSGEPVDSCQAAGLVCDQTLSVCRNPNYYDSCTPGGPACNQLSGTSADSVVCVNLAPLQAGSTPGCFQACQTNADCLNPIHSCDGFAGGNFCYLFSSPACTDYFGTCNAAGTNDGVCVDVTFTGQAAFGDCVQAATDGGTTGAACSTGSTRQNPADCDVNDLCAGGLCQPTCNISGTDHLCPAGTVCTASTTFFNLSSVGTCLVSCDFTLTTGGLCVTSDAGVATKCLPGLFTGTSQADNGTGFCVAEPPTTLALGAPCLGVDPGYADPCVAGAACIGNATTGFFCTQLCTNVGLLCADGVKSCNSLNGLNETGVCF